MKLSIYNAAGKAGKEVTLSDAVFGVSMNKNLIHQVLVSIMANKRQGNAHTKDRSEVRGGGKKPWRQKGTGNARHGSRRSPIWVGGGTTFGPRSDKDYSQKINKKTRNHALAMLLSAQMKASHVLGLESLSFETPKTQEAQTALDALAGVDGFATLNTRTNKNNVLIVTADGDKNLVKSFANIPHVTVRSARELSPLDVAQKRYLVLVDPAQVDAVLAARIGGTYSETFTKSNDAQA